MRVETRWEIRIDLLHEPSKGWPDARLRRGRPLKRPEEIAIGGKSGRRVVVETRLRMDG